MLRKPSLLVSLSGLLVLIALLAIPSNVFAGGWVVISLDSLPENLTAGQPYRVGMTARQHGLTPWVVDELVIEARQPGGSKLTFSAKPEGEPGHYQAELLFPQPGRWEWGVASGMLPDMQPLPALDVARSASAKDTQPGSLLAAFNLPGAAFLVPGLLALLAFTTGMVLLIRSRNKPSPRLAGLGLLLLCGGLAFAFFSSTNAAVKDPVSSPQAAAGATQGQRLFLAKGCVVCHSNNRALSNSASFELQVGPDLSEYHGSREFLGRWLADPQAVRPGSEMPDQKLSAEEIEALARFLSEQ